MKSPLSPLRQSAAFPESVTVVFPGQMVPIIGTTSTSAPVDPPPWYKKVVTIADVVADGAGLPNINPLHVGFPGSKIIHDSCPAMFNGNGTATSNITNKTALDDLALQIAKDFYLWRSLAYDIVYNGIINPGYDATIDEIEIIYNPESDEACKTRISSAPWDGEPEEYMHASALTADEKKVGYWCFLDAGLLVSGGDGAPTKGFGIVHICTSSGRSLTSTSALIGVYNVGGAISGGGGGTYIQVTRSDNQWGLTVAACGAAI